MDMNLAEDVIRKKILLQKILTNRKICLIV